MSIKDSIRSVVAKLGLSQSMWSGDFKNWESALQKGDGYSSSEIMEKVTQAVLKVKSGEAVYERDSVLFDKIEYSWPLLSSLLWVAAKNNNSLKVLDFGGSLGSSYFQNRKFLNELGHVEWNIVEQDNFVTTGRDCIEDQHLQFFYSVEECISKKGKPDILILACTLPYIEKPYQLIKELLNYGFPHIIIDNTFFNYEDRDRITVQKVPPSIYAASYPCWFLSYKKLIGVAGEKYTIVSEHTNETKIFLDGNQVQYQGFLAQLI